MQLHIENYKCFSEQTINFGKLTVLAGANSAGKSSTVQSILLMRLAIEKSKKNEAIIPVNGEYCLALGLAEKLINSSSSSSSENNFLLSFKDNEEISYDVDFTFNRDMPYGFEFTSNGNSNDNLLSGDFYYLNAERIGPRLDYKVDNFKHAGYNGEYAVQMVADLGFKTNELKSFADDIPHNLRDQAHAWLEYVTPGVKIGGSEVYDSIRTAKMEISGTTPTNVGFGVSYVLPIIVNGLLAKPNSVFIVENPEAHLHPSAQSRIGRFLAKIAATGVNVIVETHSEHVINGIRLSTLNNTINNADVIINFFSKNEKKEYLVTQIEINDKGELSEWPRGFFDQEEQDLSEIFKLTKKR